MDKFISKVNIEDLKLLCDPKKLKKNDRKSIFNEKSDKEFISEKSDKEVILINKDINKFKEIMKEKIDNFNNKNNNDRYYILIEALWHKYISENIDFMEYSKNSIGEYSKNNFLESLIIDNKFDILGNVNI
tara:strand:+ start:1174 stop:1566 length:393 start_codon:yes stop_codon:yes gene_type:complete